MGRLNVKISDSLDQEMREYIDKNNLTITTFLHLAISKYLESQKEVKEIKKMFTELLNKQMANKIKGKIDY